MAETTKRKGGGRRRTETTTDRNARARKLLRRQLRERKEITRLCRQVERETRRSDRALRDLVAFVQERDGDGIDEPASGRAALETAADDDVPPVFK